MMGVDDRFQVLAAVDFPKLGREKGQWSPAVPPLCRASTGLCPADYFGRTMVSNLPPQIKVGVVNVSVAGCKIELFEKETFQKYAAAAPNWMTNIINGYGGNPYQHLVDLVNTDVVSYEIAKAASSRPADFELEMKMLNSGPETSNGNHDNGDGIAGLVPTALSSPEIPRRGKKR